MTTTAIGQEAEARAAEYLIAHGYSVVGRNWRTRWCEIDIVVRKIDVIWFVEVKHRANAHYGDGLDYITPAKLRQMRFAAELWVAQHDYQGEYGIAAIALSGSDFVVTDFLTDLT